MGHKINPNIIRLGILKNWGDLWFSDFSYNKLLLQDFFIRRYVKALFKPFGFQVLRVSIKKNIKGIYITIRVFNWNKRVSDMVLPYLANIKWWFARRVFQNIIQRLMVGMFHLTGLTNIRFRFEVIEWQTSSVDTLIEFSNPKLFANYIMRNHRRMYSGKKTLKILRSKFKDLPLHFSLLQGLRIHLSGPLKAPRQRRAQTYRYTFAGPVPLQTFSTNILYSVMSRVLSEGLVTTKIWVRLPSLSSLQASRIALFSKLRGMLKRFKLYKTKLPQIVKAIKASHIKQKKKHKTILFKTKRINYKHWFITNRKFTKVVWLEPAVAAKIKALHFQNKNYYKSNVGKANSNFKHNNKYIRK